MNESITLHCISLGQMQTNCYITANNQTKEAIIFDPGDDGARVISYLEKNELKLKAILVTHGHFDHIMAVPDLLEEYGNLPVYIQEEESDVISNPDLSLCSMIGSNVKITPTNLVKDGDEISLIGCKMTCIHVPGHTKGGVCYYFKEQGWLISGDTLFQQSIGRTDFPTGDLNALLSGIREKLFVLPDETVVLSGHTPKTTIGFEKKSNPFLR
ncbi:MAG: MBL fold metallo-hydrolase [Anaerostipes sp.]|nr:MBL fold metallo-hydrolase [Anaerostipes sp.]